MTRSPFPLIQYPPAHEVDVVDVYHDVSVRDPYRWLEDLDSPETRTWIDQQNALTEDFLARIPQREQIRQRLRAVWNYERSGIPRRVGTRLMYWRNDGLQQQSVLYVLDTEGADPRVLLDPNLLSTDGTVAVPEVDPSPDGRFLAYGVSDAGSDWVEIRIRDIVTGQDLPDHVRWSKYFVTAWRRDGSGFYYAGYEAPDEKSALKAPSLDQRVYYHALGTAVEDDVVVYRRPDEPKWMYLPYVTEDDGHLILQVFPGSLSIHFLFSAAIDSSGNVKERVQGNPAGNAAAAGSSDSIPVTRHELWSQLVPDRKAQFHPSGSIGSRVLFRTDDDAPFGRVVAIDVANPRSQPVEFVAESSDRLDDARLIGGRIVCSYLHDACSRVALFDLEGQFVQDVPLPGLGSAVGFKGERDEYETYFAFTNFNTPMEVWKLDVRSGSTSPFWKPRVDFRSEDYVTHQVFVASKDGTRVPMFLTHRADLARDGKSACLLGGYGGFNVPQTPNFSVPAQVWLEMGGIWAAACLRGGGEYGRDWHEAGTRTRKQNVFDDFIACAEWLIAEGYTSKERLAIHGRSNGGLLVGACLIQRPDLFGACLPAVGVMDMLRYHTFTVGWAWESDYGSIADEAEFRALLAYSPLHTLRPGTSYPPTLIGTADHDDRVFPGHSFKFAAAMQKAHRGENPVLLRVETRAGHGMGKPTSMVIEDTVDRWAFLAWALGMDDWGRDRS